MLPLTYVASEMGVGVELLAINIRAHARYIYCNLFWTISGLLRGNSFRIFSSSLFLWLELESSTAPVIDKQLWVVFTYIHCLFR